MPTTLDQVANQFNALSIRIEKAWTPQYAKNASFKKSIGWQASALSPADAIDLADAIAARIRGLAEGEDATKVESGPDLVVLGNQADELEFSSLGSDPINVIRATFEFLLFVSTELPPRPVDVDWEKVAELPIIPKRLGSRLRSLEARLDDLEPRASVVDAKIKVIEDAHDAAEKLPTDLEELARASKSITDLLKRSTDQEFQIGVHLKLAKENSDAVDKAQKQAAQLVQKCEEAYRITTSAGLAGAFEYRSKSLSLVGWVWVCILIASLSAAVVLGKDRYDGLKSLLTGDHEPALIYLNLIFAVLGVAAPVWLAWLATRSIGQSFRLSEDYAFKASVSKAYEGYRKEAVTLDEEFAKRLFGSALNRLDEPPSRFIVAEDHSTPIEALLENDHLKGFFAKFPAAQEMFGKFMVDAKSTVVGAVAGVAAVAGADGEKKKPIKTPSDAGNG